MLDHETREALRQGITGLRASMMAAFEKETRSRYHLDVPVEELDDGDHGDTLRARAALELWLDEEARAEHSPKTLAALARGDAAAVALHEDTRQRLLREAQARVGATWVHRLVVLRQVEALGLRKQRYVTGGWGATIYKDLAAAAPELCVGVDQGYAFFLGLLVDEMATLLPGLFGRSALVALLPLPHSALRDLITLLNDPALEPAWRDDMTLGWIYQYWNDPVREDLDKKINEGGKIAPHEIAPKTQMFTDRYMAQWLVQNTLNPWWLAICQRNGWTPEAQRDGVLDALEAQRAAWRAALAAGEQAAEAPMRVLAGTQERWCWYVPRPVSAAMLEAAPRDPEEPARASLRGLKLMEPSCGSGHILVLALEQLFSFYQEEARQRRAAWTPQEIVQWIIGENLHGLDIDPRAVQCAVAALWLKAQVLAPGARLGAMKLVATDFSFARLAWDDVARVEFREGLRARVGVEAPISDAILSAIGEAHHMGTLVRVDKGIEAALARGGMRAQQTDLLLPSPAQAQEDVMEALERFVVERANQQDLAGQLRGEQVAAGARFVRMVQPGQYHVVLGNPPYQGANRLEDAAWLKKHYPAGKADLFAAFLLRGLELTCLGGLSALLTMRNWMFIKTYQELREAILSTYDLDVLLDLDRGAFAEVHNDVLAVSVAVFCNFPPDGLSKLALQPTPISDTSYDKARTRRKESLVLAQVGRFNFQPQALRGVNGWRLVYWWDKNFLNKYLNSFYLGDKHPALVGLQTSNNTRFIRKPFEINLTTKWKPFIKGASGRCWFEGFYESINWHLNGIEIKFMNIDSPGGRINNEKYYFKKGIAFSMIGDRFMARAHKYSSVFGNKGASIIIDEKKNILCLMNSSESRFILESLSPGLGFEAGDVNRLPVWEVRDAEAIYDTIERAFDEHERHREASVEFKRPGPSCWRWAQAWAQRMVDREDGDPWEPFDPEYDAPQPVEFVSFAFGVALGRFGGGGEGVLDPELLSGHEALPRGIAFLSGYRDQDSLQHPACAPLRAAWQEHGPALCEGAKSLSLKDYLRERFFKEHHRTLYENRPIFWPLSSSKRSFVAWVSIHRMSGDTLPVLLVDHLLPEQAVMEAERKDLQARIEAAEGKEKAPLEKRISQVLKLQAELEEFIKAVRVCALNGAPYPGAAGAKAPAGRAEAVAFAPVLDDGVMINSGALWPLLEPQWKDPKGWFKELCEANGRKDYDWSRLAARLYPARVERKCTADPSLAVAHGCFWRLHPALAYEWELRLQHELSDPTFTLDELDAKAHREHLLAYNPSLARGIEAREALRLTRLESRGEVDDGREEEDTV